MKLNCVHINFREHNVHSCLFLFSFSATHSSIRFLSCLLLLFGEIIRMAAIHLDLSSAIDRWNCCIFLRRAHSFLLWALANDRTNEWRRENVLITAENWKFRRGGQPTRVVRRIGVQRSCVMGIARKKNSTFISNVGSISIRSLDRVWNKINEMKKAFGLWSLRTVIERKSLVEIAVLRAMESNDVTAHFTA